MPSAWFALILSSLLPPFRPAPFLRRLSTRLPLPPRRHAAAPRTGAPRGCPGRQTRQRRPLQNTRRPRNRGRSFSLARWERVGVRVFRATRPASAPSPQRTPKTSPKGAPNYLKSFLEETLPAHETAHSHPASRHPATSHPRSVGSSSLARWQRLGVSVSPAPAPSPQPLPVRPPSAPDLTARPSPLSPSSLPPHLKSFLEKTLTRAKPPHFAPPTTHPSSVPNHPSDTTQTGDNQIADPLPGRTR